MTTENAYSVVQGEAKLAQYVPPSVVKGEAKLSELAPMWEYGEVTVTFYDGEANKIDEETDYAFVNPGETWEFEVECWKDFEYCAASSYEIVAAEWTEVLSSEMTLSTGSTYSRTSEVTVTFHDADGNMIGTGSDYTFLADPGETWDFSFICWVDTEYSIAANYDIVPDEWTEVLNSEMVTNIEHAWSVVKGEALEWVTVVVKFYDQNGILLGQMLDVTSHLAAGETWAFEISSLLVFEGPAASYEVLWED